MPGSPTPPHTHTHTYTHRHPPTTTGPFRHDQPVVTIIDNERFPNGEVVETVDAFEKSVGKMVLAPADVVDKVISRVA